MTNTNFRKNALVCLAMLKVQMDQQQGSYVDYFIPYFLQILKKQFDSDNQNTELDFPDIQSSMESMYGLKLPIHVIELIIKRIAKSNPLVLKKENFKYCIVNVEDISNQDENFSAAERGTTAVCNALVKFSQDKPLPFNNINEAFEAILEFLSEFSIEAIANIQKNSALPELSDRNDKRIVLSALFVQYLSNNDTENYNNFSNIVKGYMLTNVLLCLDITEREAGIHTCFYIDTPLVLSCLGLAGEARKKPIKELFALILKLNGKLRVFSHTVEEIQGVLASYGKCGDTYSNERRHNLTTSDIVVIQENLEETLKKEKIKIEQTPTATNKRRLYKYQIDESKLENILKEKIHYRGQKAHEYDAKSVAAIHLLRRGKVHYQLEQVPSLVTDNTKLVATATEFERKNNLAGRCSAITSFMVTNLLWLKNPMESPDLPMQTIIAQSYSHLDNPELWDKFLQKAEQLQQSGSITKEEVQYLRGSERILQGIVSEATLGDSGDLENKQIVSAICEEAKRKITRKAMDRAAIAEGKLSIEKKKVLTLSACVAHVLTIMFYVLLALLLEFLFVPAMEYFSPATQSVINTIRIIAAGSTLTYKEVYKFCTNKILNWRNSAK